MNAHEKRERHWQRTLEVAATMRDRPAPWPGATPEKGEIYLCRKTADFPLEWLVVEVEEERLRVVPVDDYPLVGSRDVELNWRAFGGVAVARCAYGTWITGHRLEAELRTGILEAGDFEATQNKLGAVDTGRVEAVLLDEVVDGDPEYQHWCEGTLAAAVETLVAVDAKQKPVWLTELRRYWKQIAAVAALLALTLGLGGYVSHVDAQLSLARERLAELEGQVPKQHEQYAEQTRRLKASETETTRLSELLEAVQTSLDLARGEIATKSDQVESLERRLGQALKAGVTANVQKLIFGAAQRSTRGGDPGMGSAVSTERNLSDRFFFELEVVDPEPYLSYRVRLQPRTGTAISVDTLARDGAWLRFSLPAEVLAVADYQLLIDGVDSGRHHELAERYRLVVE